MIQITFFKNRQDVYQGFRFIGHAEYASAGEDVVCAGISALAINTVNSIDALTEDTFTCDTDEKTGQIEMHFTDSVSHDADLLLHSLSIGCQGISDSYGTDFVKVHFKEV